MKNSVLDEVRLLVLNGYALHVRRMLLTADQLDLVLFIKVRGETTASDISRVKKVSIQNASTKLAALHNKGYLTRETNSAKTGGIEHVYTAMSINETKPKACEADCECYYCDPQI